MEISTMIWIGAGVVCAIGAVYLTSGWISIYNKFIYWKNKLDERFAGIDVVMQRRSNIVLALAQIAKKYSIHEYKTIKDTIEARSRWSKDIPINEKIKSVEVIEKNFLNLQAVFERYPKVRADKLYQQIMGSGDITHENKKVAGFMLEYNNVVRNYNQRVQTFPRNIVAKVHGFKTAEYLNLGQQETYKPKEIFHD